MDHTERLNPKYTVDFGDGRTKTYNFRRITNVEQLWSGMEVVFVQEEGELVIWQLPTTGSMDDLYQYYKDSYDIDLDRLRKFSCFIKY